MCLAVPGRVVMWINRDPIFAQAEVEFDGVRRTCSLACTPDADVGDYVIVHAGLAISIVDEAAAAAALADLERLEEYTAARDGWSRGGAPLPSDPSMR